MSRPFRPLWVWHVAFFICNLRKLWHLAPSSARLRASQRGRQLSVRDNETLRRKLSVAVVT
eukprot:5641952-Pyramimonas_sp.AAC.2